MIHKPWLARPTRALVLVAILVLGVAVLLGGLLPALRATRINPITALRE